MSDLTGKTVAIIASDFFEEPELVRPRDQLREAGATVRIYSPSGDPIQAVQGDIEPTQQVDVDGTWTTSTRPGSTPSSFQAAP